MNVMQSQKRIAFFIKIAMENAKFYLHFLSDGFGKVEISEPIGMSSTSFELRQKEKGYGRDISFAGGETQFEFSYYRDHYLYKLLYYYHRFGFESKVNLIIEINGIENIVGELDFATAITDDLQYFKCNVIQDTSLQVIKRRSKVKVDMFSDKDLDGNDIDKAPTTNVLVKAKAVFQESKWEQQIVNTVTTTNLGNFINVAQSLTQYEIEDTYTPSFPNSTNGNDFLLLTAKNNIRSLRINISNLKGIITQETGTGDSNLGIHLDIKKGLTYATSELIADIRNVLIKNGESVEFNINTIIDIPELKRGESIWIYLFIGQILAYKITAIVNTCQISITAESTAYNSITKAVRLNDVQKQIIKSYAGLNVLAPRYEPNGEFYDTFLLNGNLLRSITDKPFEISLDDIEESLTEHNASYEVNDRVFFGTYPDFYTNTECGFFDNTQFSQFSKKFNEKHSINTFNFKYKAYQALKENEQPNSDDTIHGETTMLLGNKMVENTKAVMVEWIRDSFLIDEARKKSIEITTGTAYQNDSDLFALDCVKNENDLSYTEASELNHEWNTGTSKLILRSNETLNFKIIGVFEGTPFEIKAPDKNTGFYTVSKVSEQELQLTWVSGGAMTTNNDGVRFTQYTYLIPKEQIPYVSRTTEGITTTSNIKSPETFANILYSVKRNILNYYNSYLATCNLYHKEKAITTTAYKNNGEATIVANDVTTVENQEIVPSGIILSPIMYNDIIFANVEFEDYLELTKNIRSKRGFIRCIDNNDRVIKIYPVNMKWDVLSKELNIKAEEKYDPIDMTIIKENKIITINGEVQLYNLLWKIEDDKLAVFDMNRERLFNPVFWDAVTINEAFAPTITVLEEWMALLGTKII
jgi:hypothetical protein